MGLNSPSSEDPSYGGHFRCLYSEKSVPKHSGEPFYLPGGHFETADQLLKNHHFAKNWFPKQGTDHRKAKFPHLDHRFAIAIAIAKRSS